jgi:hypothetical protein
MTTETIVDHLGLVVVANTVDTADEIEYTHFGDSEAAGTVFSVAAAASGKRIAHTLTPINSEAGIFHSGRFEMATRNEVSESNRTPR